VSWFEIVVCVCALVVGLQWNRTTGPDDEMLPLDRFDCWHDMLMDASPTFLEHTNLVLRATQAKRGMEESKA